MMLGRSLAGSHELFIVEEYDSGASLQASYASANQHIKRAFNGRREAQPSRFSNCENVLNVCKVGRAKPCL
jgi:hypothetical protein